MSTIQDPATQAINYVVPIVGQVAAATDAAEGIQDISENGLNLENALQTGISVLPFLPMVKPLVKPALSFIKES